MNARLASRLAWTAFGVVGLLYLAGMAFSVLNLGENHPELSALDPVVLVFFSFPVVGVLVATRRPRNPIGWILLGIGFSWGLYVFLSGYSLYALVVDKGALPRADLSLALNSWTWVPAVGLMGTFLILLFPNGRLPSMRWRPLAWLSALVLVILSISGVIMPGEFANSGFSNVTNPLGIEALRPIIAAIDVVGLVLLLVCIVASAASAGLRFRRSQGQERLQLKWLAAGAATATASYLAFMTSGAVTYLTRSQSPPQWAKLIQQYALWSFVLIPIAVGVAILRYRLYDIDRIINRTLVYGVLTAVLAAIYAGLVVGLPTLLDESVRDSQLLVAGATLLVATLFQPVRRRVQSFIDRRFYRHKYDAEQTLADFSARLQHGLELESVDAELVGAVTATMHPAHASLWLRVTDDLS
jgi:uncharacterized membrane protein